METYSAIAIIPNFFVTGILAIIASCLVIIWGTHSILERSSEKVNVSGFGLQVNFTQNTPPYPFGTGIDLSGNYSNIRFAVVRLTLVPIKYNFPAS